MYPVYAQRYSTRQQQISLTGKTFTLSVLLEYWQYLETFQVMQKGSFGNAFWWLVTKDHFRFLTTETNSLEWDIVAKAKKFDNGYKFINVKVDSRTKRAFDEWAGENDQKWVSILHEVVTNEWKHSLSWDGENMCYIASLTCNADRNRYHKCVFTARSAEPIEAVLLVLFKVVVLAEKSDLTAMEQSDNWG